VGVPVVKVQDNYYLSPHFGRAPLFALVKVSGEKYDVVEVLENVHAHHERGRGRGVVELLASRGVNAVILLGVGPGAFYRLRERGIKVYYVPAEIASRALVPLSIAVEMFINNQLEEAREPREMD